MKDKKVLILVIISLLLAVCVSSSICFKRINAEAKDSSVDVTADYADIERLAAFEHVTVTSVLQSLKSAGIASVAVTEDLAANADPNFLIGVDPKKLNLYVSSLGLSTSKVSRVESSGLRVIPRIRNQFRLDARIISDKLSSIARYGTVIFAEEEVLGYPNYLNEAAGSIRKNMLTYGFVEFGKQLGDSALASRLGGSMVKVHSIPLDEMEKLTKDDMVNRYLRAAKERNIRLLYVHLLQYPDRGKGLIGTNTDFINIIIKELKAANFSIGKASGPGSVNVTRNEKRMISMGVGGGLLLLASFFVPVNFISAVVILLLFILLPSSKLIALISAIVFPSYAVISQFPLKKEKIKLGLISRAISITMYTAGITAAGAIMIAAILSDKISMLGVDAFSGVKIAFILPLIIVASYFFLRGKGVRLDLPGSLEKIKELSGINITLTHALFLSLLAAAGALLILRSGNFGVPVPGFEKTARGLLENLFVIRPRTKEFLIGYPVLFLAAIYYLKGGSKWLWAYLLISVLAPISLINSFCHVHTPLVISVLRSCAGLIIGITLGLLAYLGYNVSQRLIKYCLK